MDLKRLFHVLVIGGSVGSVATGCERTRVGGLGVAGAEDARMPDSAAPDGPTAAEDAALESGVPLDATASDVISMDVGAPADAAAPTDASDGPAGSPCICSPTKCCDLHDDGPATVQPGVFCCWGTKC